MELDNSKSFAMTYISNGLYKHLANTGRGMCLLKDVTQHSCRVTFHPSYSIINKLKPLSFAKRPAGGAREEPHRDQQVVNMFLQIKDHV